MEKIAVILLLLAGTAFHSLLFSQAIEPIVVIILSEDNTRDPVSEPNYFENVPGQPVFHSYSYPGEEAAAIPFDLYAGQNSFFETYENLYSKKTGIYLAARTGVLRFADFNSTVNVRIYNRYIRESIKVRTKSSFINIENRIKAKITGNVSLENLLQFQYSRDSRFFKGALNFYEKIPAVSFKQSLFVDYPLTANITQTGFLYENTIHKTYTPSFCFTYRPDFFIFSPAFRFNHRVISVDGYTDIITNFRGNSILNWDFFIQGKAADKVVFSFFKETGLYNRKHFSSFKSKVKPLSGKNYITAAGAGFQCAINRISLIFANLYYFTDLFLSYSILQNLMFSYPDMLIFLTLLFRAEKWRMETTPFVFFPEFRYSAAGFRMQINDIKASFVTLAPGCEVVLANVYNTLRTQALLDITFTISERASMFLKSKGGFALNNLTGPVSPDYLFTLEGGITIFW